METNVSISADLMQPMVVFIILQLCLNLQLLYKMNFLSQTLSLERILSFLVQHLQFPWIL